MCTANGITASIAFDRPFSGIIYSLNYANVHDCVYYNALLSDNVLFSIPANRCGTRMSHDAHATTMNIENRVYVQIDKLAQTAADKQYAFVCQQAFVPTPVYARVSNEIRRHPAGGSNRLFASSPPSPLAPIVPIVNGRRSFFIATIIIIVVVVVFRAPIIAILAARSAAAAAAAAATAAAAAAERRRQRAARFQRAVVFLAATAARRSF